MNKYRYIYCFLAKVTIIVELNEISQWGFIYVTVLASQQPGT